MSSANAPSHLLITLQTLQKRLYQIGGPTLIFIGTVGCLLRLLVFNRRVLRKNPCSIYYTAHNAANFLFIYSAIIALTLSVGYDLDATVYHLSLCRLRLYAALVSSCSSPLYLILASVDRVLVTSSNIVTRQRSTRSLAYQCVASGALFWCLCHGHLLVFSEIIQLGPSTRVCYYQPGLQLAFMGFFQIIKELTAYSAMVGCGLWPMYNLRVIRRIRNVPHTVSHFVTGTTARTTSSKDRQFILMILMDTSIYALFTVAFATFLMYQQITQYRMKSSEQLQIELVVRNICLFSMSIPFCLGCYTNLFISKTFRTQVTLICARR